MRWEGVDTRGNIADTSNTHEQIKYIIGGDQTALVRFHATSSPTLHTNTIGNEPDIRHSDCTRTILTPSI
jgi:hypothetical protein